MRDRFTRVCWKAEISHSRGWVVSSVLLALLPQKVGCQGMDLTSILYNVSKAWWYGAKYCRVYSPAQANWGFLCPSSLPSPVFFLFSLSPHRPVFFTMPLPDPGSSSQQGPAPSVQHLHHTFTFLWAAQSGLAVHLLPALSCYSPSLPFLLFLLDLSAGHSMSAGPDALGVAGTMFSTASCLRGVQRMHRTLSQQCPVVCEAARQRRPLCSPPRSSPHCGLSRRLGRGRADSHQGVVLGNVSLSQLQPKNGFRWGEDWGKNALGFWAAFPKNSASTLKRSLSPSSSCFFSIMSSLQGRESNWSWTEKICSNSYCSPNCNWAWMVILTFQFELKSETDLKNCSHSWTQTGSDVRKCPHLTSWFLEQTWLTPLWSTLSLLLAWRSSNLALGQGQLMQLACACTVSPWFSSPSQ